MPPVLFTPCYNEAKNIGEYLEQIHALQKAGIIGHLLLIDDGSQDGTAKKAVAKARQLQFKENEITFLRFPKNHGKARCFFEALKFYRTRFGGAFPKEQIMVALDADIKNISEKNITKLIAPLTANTETQKRGWLPDAGTSYKTEMTSGKVEKGFLSNTGQRAFYLESFRPLLERKSLQAFLLGGQGKKGPSTHLRRGGYGLESFLNWYFTRLPWGVGGVIASHRGHYNLEKKAQAIPRTEIIYTDFTTPSFIGGPKGKCKGSKMDKTKLQGEIDGVYSRWEERMLMAGLAREQMRAGNKAEATGILQTYRKIMQKRETPKRPARRKIRI